MLRGRPGFTVSEMTEEYLAGRGGAQIVADIPLGRVATTDEVAETVRWLAVDAPAVGDRQRDRRQRRQLCPVSWRVTICLHPRPGRGDRRDGAELFPALPNPPVLVADEPDAARPDEWLIHAYFDHEPTRRRAGSGRRGLGSGAPRSRATRRGRLGDDEPGGPAADPRRPLLRPHADLSRPVPAGAIAFEIDASLAFGTGQHATTSGCLAALDRARARRARASPTSPTSAPAPACSPLPRCALWPEAKCIATDIDPVAIDVARDNAAINRVTLGHGAGELLLAVADGMDSPLLAARAPFDLIIANILAGPLIELAPDFARCAGAGRDGRPRGPARHAGRRR